MLTQQHVLCVHVASSDLIGGLNSEVVLFPEWSNTLGSTVPSQEPLYERPITAVWS